MDAFKSKVDKMVKDREKVMTTLTKASSNRLEMLIMALRMARDTGIDGQDFLDGLQGEIDKLAFDGCDKVKKAVKDDWMPENEKSVFDCVIAEAARIGVLLSLDHIVRKNVFQTDRKEEFIYQINNVMPFCDQNLASLVELFDEMRKEKHGENHLKLMYERMEEIRNEGIDNQDLIKTTLGLSADYAISVCMISLLEKDTEYLQQYGDKLGGI